MSGALLALALVAGPIGADEAQRRARRPVALVLAEGRWLWAANERSGSLSLVDARSLERVDEFDVAAGLRDLSSLPTPGRLLALDHVSHRLLVLDAAPGDVRVRHAVPVASYPVRVVADDEGRRCYVTSLWSRRLEVFALSPDAPPRRLHSIALPFAPRELLPLGQRLLVADAFGGGLALVDPARGEVEARLELPIHNIGGLALTGDGGLAIAHQSLNPYATTNREDVFWGVLVSNRLLLVAPDDLAGPPDEMLLHGRMLDLGDLTSPAGDPGRVALTPTGELAVLLAGTGRVGVGRPGWPRLDHVKVGGHPVALAASADGRLFVADDLDDAISVVDLATRRRTARIPLGPERTPSEAERGEALFYDARLSLRGWMSCHSCHTGGHANGALADTLGDGGFGAPKRVPSLLGVAASGPWAWNGGVDTLAKQVRKSVHTTLNNPDADPADLRALEAFLETLEPPELPPDDPEAARRGRTLFFESGCDRCHTPPSYTSARSRDVGLEDERGRRLFNPPSLRGVRHRSSFLHDGRARSLEDVFTVHGHPGDAPLSESQVRDLVAFLSSL